MTDTRARVCGTKQRHDKTGAETHRRALIRSGASPARVKAYKCKHCGTWHVGHPPRRRR